MQLQKETKLSLKVKNGIVGFDDFWYGCQISAELSILTSNIKDLKEKIFIYNNFYKYNVEEHVSNTKVKFFTLKAENFFNLSNAFDTTYRSEVNDINAMIKDIKKRIWKKEYIYVGINLFYLLPGTFCYNKFHWMHYTFVTGYDIFKKEFYVLEHTPAHGYRNYAIPEERFKTALLNSDLRIKIFVNKIRKNYQYREFRIDELLEQAEQLKENIREILKNDTCLFKLSDENYSEEYFMDLSCQELFVIMNHMKANKRLFEQLYEKNVITSMPVYQKLCDLCCYLLNGWNYAKISLSSVC